MRRKIDTNSVLKIGVQTSLTKTTPKAFGEKFKEKLSSIITQNQTTYVKNCFLRKSGRLIADIVDVYDIENIPGNFVTRS